MSSAAVAMHSSNDNTANPRKNQPMMRETFLISLPRDSAARLL
jgi:hypothetical protein